MKIVKAGEAAGGCEVSSLEMEMINAFAKAPLSSEEVFSFSVVLCDNEVDRDFEAFSDGAIFELRELFVGKTGIFDHDWKSGNQIARIYAAEVLREAGKATGDGRDYVCLKAMAYMLRTPTTAGIIAEISGGIKKEVSISCSMARCICSVCGEEIAKCGHTKGQEYDGAICFGILDGAVDAYEWSFVAVPAQRAAGVTKALPASGGLRGFVESRKGAGFAGEFEGLCKEAALGRQYVFELRREVSRLCLLTDKALFKSLENAISGMDATALCEMKAALEAKVFQMFPAKAQLFEAREAVRFDGESYII